MKRRLLVLVSGLVLMSGCSDMGETGQGAMMGTLMGTAAGALMGKKKDRGKNALIGAGVGLLGGALYGKNREANRLKKENAVLRRELENIEMRRELERLRKENQNLKQGKPTAYTLGDAL